MFVIRIEFADEVDKGDSSIDLCSQVTLVLPGYLRAAIAGLAPYAEHLAVSATDLGPSMQAAAQITADPPRVNLAQEEALSFDATILLDALRNLGRRAIQQKSPTHAWRTKSDWFQQAGLNRHREDAESLIAELSQARLIDCRNRGKWKQYRATKLA